MFACCFSGQTSTKETHHPKKAHPPQPRPQPQPTRAGLFVFAALVKPSAIAVPSSAVTRRVPGTRQKTRLNRLQLEACRDDGVSSLQISLAQFWQWYTRTERLVRESRIDVLNSTGIWQSTHRGHSALLSCESISVRICRNCPLKLARFAALQA